MDYIVGILSNLLTPEWISAAIFNLVLLIVVYVRSRRSSSVESENQRKAEPDITTKKITIINNVRGGRISRRNKFRRRRSECTNNQTSSCDIVDNGEGD